MKTKRLFAFMFAITLSVAIHTSSVFAQRQAIGFTVPFDFSINGRMLPAGEYRIETRSDSRLLWGIRGADNASNEFLLASTLGGSSDGNILVTFHHYGDEYFLAGFKTLSYEVSLPASKAEKSIRYATGPMANMDVIKIKPTETVSPNDSSGSDAGKIRESIK